MTKSIAFVSTGDPYVDDYPDPSYGTSIQIWGLAKEMASRGHHVTIYSASKNRMGKSMHSGVCVFDIPARLADMPHARLFTNIFFSRKAKNKIAEFGHDVVLSRERFSSVFPIRMDIPNIFTLSSPDACDFFYEEAITQNPLNRLVFQYKQLVEEHALRNTDRVIVMNERMEEYVSDYNHVDVISIGIDPEEFTHPEGDIEDQFILYAGRMDYNKRPSWVLDAFNSIDKNGFHLHFAGEGEKLEEVKQKARKNGLQDLVHFHGWIPRKQLLQLMESASIFILPSKFDNSPNVILEAMGAKTAVLSSNTMGAQSMINDENTGLLFEKDDKTILTKKLELLIKDDNLRMRLSNNAREYAFKYHDLKVIADQYIDTIRKVT